MDHKLKTDIIGILEYFRIGLSDIEAGSGEKQPMLKEIKSVLRRLEANHKYCQCRLFGRCSIQMADGHYECLKCRKEIKSTKGKQ